MKTTYHNIPALPFAADADVEKLRRQLEGGNLEVNEDGTLSTKDSKNVKPTTATSKANEIKRKQGDVPGGVLGAESLRDILARAEESEVSPDVAAMINEFRSDEEPSALSKASKEQKKPQNTVPAGVLGMPSV